MTLVHRVEALAGELSEVRHSARAETATMATCLFAAHKSDVVALAGEAADIKGLEGRVRSAYVNEFCASARGLRA